MWILWLVSYGVTHRRRPCQSRATHSLSQASSTRSPGSPVVQWSSDTCDDDLGNIQNGAEWCCFTVASFILGACCENTYTHTYSCVHNKHADYRLGAHCWTGNVGHTHAEHTMCYVQGQHAPRPFQTLWSGTMLTAGSHCMTFLSTNNSRHSAECCLDKKVQQGNLTEGADAWITGTLLIKVTFKYKNLKVQQQKHLTYSLCSNQIQI